MSTKNNRAFSSAAAALQTSKMSSATIHNSNGDGVTGRNLSGSQKNRLNQLPLEDMNDNQICDVCAKPVNTCHICEMGFRPIDTK